MRRKFIWKNKPNVTFQKWLFQREKKQRIRFENKIKNNPRTNVAPLI
jgi:hypothetical protein